MIDKIKIFFLKRRIKKRIKKGKYLY